MGRSGQSQAELLQPELLPPGTGGGGLAVQGQPFARCGAPPALLLGSAAAPRSGSGESCCILFYFGLGCSHVYLFVGWLVYLRV